MIDTLLAHQAKAHGRSVPAQFDLAPGKYGVLTLHRPSNVDDLATFDRIVEAIGTIGQEIPILFPAHPRTRPMIARSTRAGALIREGALRVVDPLGYVEFVGLLAGSRIVLTDSGGVQEETTILDVPCLTLRENTERPVTITHGTNQLVGTDPARIVDAWRRLRTGTRRRSAPPLWDGQAANRIVAILQSLLPRKPPAKTKV
jgi:UDP-N-acetylglucosamine 2-epimerase (non-hydrolysing)